MTKMQKLPIEEQLSEEITNMVTTLEDVVHVMRDLRQQIFYNKRDIRTYQTKISKLEKEIEMLKLAVAGKSLQEK